MSQTQQQAKWYINNRERILEKRILYREKNRQLLAEKQRAYCEKNPEVIKSYRERNKEKLVKKKAEYDKIYFANNKDKKIKQSQEWRVNNIEKSRSHKRQYSKKRRDADPAYKAMMNTRTLIRLALKKQSARKNTKSANLLGCTAKEFAAHIESQFEPWMTWDNLGVCTGKIQTTWHIDHIIPLSKFDLTDPEQQKIAFHYTNCRPLDSLINVREGNRR